jgi:Rrf2 family protein
MAPANTQFAVAVHMMAVLGCHSAVPGADAVAPITSSYLAASVNATPSFVRRVLAVLAKAGLVKTVRGPSGSCSLQKPPEEITLLDIYRAVDAPKVFALHSYPPEEKCSVSCRMNKVMTGLLDQAQDGMEQSLAGKTLAQFVGELKQ